MRQALRLAPDHRARLVCERQARQSDERLQRGMRAVHVGSNHRQSHFMAGLILGDFQIGRAQTLVIRLGPGNVVLQGLDSGVFGTAVAHHDRQLGYRPVLCEEPDGKRNAAVRAPHLYSRC